MSNADALVLGAGIVGVSVALHLQKRGRATVLVDRRGDLDHPDLLQCGLVADPVHHVRRLQHQEARLVDEDARLGDALQRHGLLRDRLAEGDA